MKEVVKATQNLSKIDLINAETSIAFKTLKGKSEAIKIKSCAIVRDVDRETGELRNFSYIFAEDGTVYGGNSESIERSSEQLIDLLDDGESVGFTVRANTTNAGREFLSLNIVAL